MALDAPNARIDGEDGKVKYATLGDKLKIQWHPEHSESGWLSYDASSLRIELNGAALSSCNRVELDFTDGFPQARLTFNVSDLEVDAATVTALQAFLKQADEEVDDDA